MDSQVSMPIGPPSLSFPFIMHSIPPAVNGTQNGRCWEHCGANPSHQNDLLVNSISRLLCQFHLEALYRSPPPTAVDLNMEILHKMQI